MLVAERVSGSINDCVSVCVSVWETALNPSTALSACETSNVKHVETVRWLLVNAFGINVTEHRKDHKSLWNYFNQNRLTAVRAG